MKKSKPEPIRVGVEGIAPAPANKPKPKPPSDSVSANEVIRICGLPPFQRFLIERGYSHPDSIKRMLEQFDFLPVGTEGKLSSSPLWSAVLTAARMNRDELLAEYAQWHTAKGLWPNETPDGRLKE